MNPPLERFSLELRGLYLMRGRFCIKDWLCGK
jgi:hypothetical protein